MSITWTLGDLNSDSYVSATYADGYFTNRPNTESWDALTTRYEKEQVLKQACIDVDMNNFRGDKYYDSQTRIFPRDDHEVYTGVCASPTINQFKGSNLWSSTYNKFPTNYFKDGTVHIKSGTNVGQVKIIISSDKSNGMTTVQSNFSASLDTTSNYTVFAPLYDDVKRAQCEQALYLLDSNLQRYIEFKNQGISGVSIGDAAVSFFKGGYNPVPLQHLGFFARKYVSRFLRKNVKVGRA